MQFPDISKLLTSENQVFAGGFGLAVLATGAQALRSSAKIGISLLKRHFLITLEVTSKDRAFPWVLQWLSAQGKRTQHLSVETSLTPSKSSSSKNIFSLVPGPGQHFLHFKGKFINVQRFREQQMVDLNTGKPWEKIQFLAFGRDPSPFEAILYEAYHMASLREEGKTIIYTNWGSEWRPFGFPRKKRPLESVILDDGISSKLFADVLEWQNSSKWYSDRGIPYRRGYLLHGPPGSGKSSFILALAGKLEYNICILNLAERGLTDDRLSLALSCVPPHSIVLLEDIDAAFPSRQNRMNGKKGGVFGGGGRDIHQGSSDVTFSGLLNVLDGVASTEERLIFMTTNHLDHLDSALIRPGRIDVVEYIGNTSRYQAYQMFVKFYPDTICESTQKSDMADKFVNELFNEHEDINISMAALQGYFLHYKNDSQKCILNVKEFLNTEINKASGASAISSPDSKLEKQTIEYDIDLEPLKSPSSKKSSSSRGPLTVDEIDKMFFNPQPDWDKDIEFFTGSKPKKQ